MTATTTPDDLPRLAREVRSLLRFQGELGLRGLDIGPGILRVESDPGSGRGSAAVDARARAAAEVAALSPRSAPARKAGHVARPAASSPAGQAISEELRAIRDDIGDCVRCGLHAGRTHVVFGAGNPRARLVFIGEGPGRDEDLQGEPFVGAAGQLLDRMIAAMGLARHDVYIANTVKCRPPGNRDPQPDELAACRGFLDAQLRVVQPEVIVTLGRVAAQALLGEQTPVTRLRGRWREYGGVPLMPTYHPAYLLRNPAEKRPVWDDLREVMKRLGLTPPPGSAG